MFEQVLNFPCPSCREIISDRMSECRFCGAPIDKGVAQHIAAVQQRVNRAFSDSGYIKNAAFLLWGLLGISLIPFVPWVTLASEITFFILLVLIARWYFKYGDIINSSDPDYQKARRSIYLATGLWAAAIPMYFIVKPFIQAKVFGVVS
jgi:hypothetical protein